MNKRYLPAFAVLLAACGAEQPAAPTSAMADECRDDGELLLHVDSPDWRDQIVYMLFIDRFDDGDPSNNDQGRGEYDPVKPTHFSGGDLQGVIDRVDYMQALGATAIWVSPPVENQWWSSLYQASGWHGYWATNFREIDPHFGTLDDYKQLSHELHCRGMYLIQDIVANHTANWWTYDGNYDPEDTAKNFRLLEEDSYQPAPTQPPFHMINRLDPEHYEADIYHWTPSITDYADVERRFTWQLGALADINTENPVVIQELKDTYNYWIEEVGVDGYRIDTVIYVPHEFWNRWAHDDDGIYAHAKSLGKEHFLSFGETFLISDPFDDAGEQELVGFFGTDEKPGLNSMLGFPLFMDINRVLGQGQPPSLLEYRLDKFMTSFPDPYVIPNFVDNHDTPRFLATGHVAALKQALAVVFTIPGIPTLYQGTEQALPETRMAMYKGGHRNNEGSFDTESEMFRFIQELAALRTENKVMTRGTLEVIASEAAGPGLLAYKREYEGDEAIILINSAEHSVLAKGVDAGVAPGTVFDIMFAENAEGSFVADEAGYIDFTLPARSILVLRPTERQIDRMAAETLSLVVDAIDTTDAFAADFELTGSVDKAGAALQLLINGDADRRTPFRADADGNWSVSVPVRDLGESSSYAQIYVPDSGELSDRVVYRTDVREASVEAQVDDAKDDGFGPAGNYIQQQHQDSGRQREIESVAVRAAGRNLELTLTMAEVTDVWLPPNGFDNVAVTTFISLPDTDGEHVLPLLDAEMPEGMDWNLAHFASGWISYTYRADGATADRQGEKLGVSPQVRGDKASRSITFVFEGGKLGIDDWDGAKILVTTWDASGEGVYVDFAPEPTDWFFSGGETGDPKIMDSVVVTVGAE